MKKHFLARLGALALFVLAPLVLAGCPGDPNKGIPACGLTGDDCTEHKECCSSACLGGVCSCGPQGVACEIDAACCQGLVCQDGMCAPGCREDNVVCEADSDCCGYGCEAAVDGVRLCDDVPRCNPADDICVYNSDCCPSLTCDNGTCQPACGLIDTACSVGSDCCAGFSCTGGVCRPVCSTPGQVCTGSVNGPFCCDGGDCNADSACEVCGKRGFACNSVDECCTGLRCDGGQCVCNILDDVCTQDSDCCPGTLCLNGFCAKADVGDRCNTTQECINTDLITDLTCQGNLCRPATCRGVNQACYDGADCCTEACRPDGTCCVPTTGSCSFDSDCCGSDVCHVDGTCGPKKVGGGDCDRAAQCTSNSCDTSPSVYKCEARVSESCGGGVTCAVNGSATCAGTTCCFELWDACNDASECCYAHGCDGNCCMTLGQQSCSSDATCCSTKYPPEVNNPTEYGVCGNVAGGDLLTECCVAPGGPCTTPSECCDTRTLGTVDPLDVYTCSEGKCCKPVNIDCAANSECCSGTCNSASNGKCA